MKNKGTVAAWLVAGLISAGVSGLPATAQDPARMGDDQFIRSLAEEGDGVDRKRLARLFFSVASTLEGGRTTVGLLREGMLSRGPGQESRQATASEHFRNYSAEVDRFKISASVLLDDPQSNLVLYGALMDGHRACWYFDRYTRFAETYGANLLSVLASSQVCQRFRAAALQPRVETLVTESLLEQAEQEREVRALREELKELETLLDDLREIERGE